MTKNRNRRRSKRSTRVLGGKGGYFDKSKNGEVTAIGKALRYLGGLGGGAVAPYAGASPGIGAAAGRKLAAHVSKWLGYGAYKVNRNSIMDVSNASIPMMHSASQAVVVRHREYIGDISSSIAFANQLELALNPGLRTTFPWLSAIARQYQEYTWRGVVFHYIPTVGEAVSSSVPAYGNVMMHTEYRVTAPAPANKAELLNEYFASDARPCESFIHPIECDPRENPYNVQYVRTGPVPAGEDAKTYDLGMFRTYVQGQSADNVIMGEIWVSYEVELRKPQLTSFSGDGALFNITGTTDTTHPLGTTVKTNFNTLGVTVTSIGGFGDITIPIRASGTYMVHVDWVPNGNMSLASLSSTFAHCVTEVRLGSDGTATTLSALPTTLPTSGGFTTIVTTDGTFPAIVRLSLGTVVNCSGADVLVARMPLQ